MKPILYAAATIACLASIADLVRTSRPDDATFLAPSTTPTEAAGAQTLEAQPHEVTAQPVAVEPLKPGTVGPDPNCWACGGTGVLWDDTPGSPNRGKQTKCDACCKANWMDDYGQARFEAKARGRKLLVRFSASWCGPCHRLDALCQESEVIQESLAKFVCLKVDVDKNPEWKMQGKDIPLEAIYDSTTMRPVCSGYNPLDLPDYASHLEAMK